MALFHFKEDFDAIKEVCQILHLCWCRHGCEYVVCQVLRLRLPDSICDTILSMVCAILKALRVSLFVSFVFKQAGEDEAVTAEALAEFRNCMRVLYGH